MTQSTARTAPNSDNPAKRIRLVMWILLGVIVVTGVIW
ncbi:LPS O-antigen subunit length determinant protein (WzzB/FepE family) [Arthrobacter sp. V4I6]|nr:LPS O-antigen subunit length determinant protein (WzzB/FepE family) [Arthrobacter sp. V1I7]MDQ0852913.1 LPS O-antigen subunit length determinant protein (WzzB/FepE family) [Arthrobacter sp. V4I6]